MRKFALVGALAATLTLAGAHPSYLDCGGLSFAIKNRSNIMTGPPVKVGRDEANFALQPSGTGFANGWTNYSIRLTESTDQLLVQADDSTAPAAHITCYGNGICGSDPSHLGHGLCQACETQLWASNFDCTEMGCVFGVAGDGDSKVAVLVGTSGGGQVRYTKVVLDA